MAHSCWLAVTDNRDPDFALPTNSFQRGLAHTSGEWMLGPGVFLIVAAVYLASRHG